MENKTARLTLLIDPNKKTAFERLCAQQDRTASQVVRQLIRDYLAEHGVDYTAAGLDEVPPQAEGSNAPSAKPKPATKSATATRPLSNPRPGKRRR